ncbi:MAG: CBS domain-containing protein [Acidimicrobiia bacterium]|jgi:CBS domain-containing protein
MKVRDLMTTQVISVGPKASLKEAARRMIEAGISGLLVTDDTGSLVGVITEADFVKGESGRRAAKRARLLRWFGDGDEMPSTERLVEDVMTSDVITLGPDADHADAARVMRKSGIKRIPIVEDDGTLRGIVSRSDILRAFARADSEIVAELRDHVMGEVLWIDPRKVEVKSVDGNVELHGHLETKSDAALLEDLTKRLDGVVSVNSHLTWEVDNTKLEINPPTRDHLARPNW